LDAEIVCCGRIPDPILRNAEKLRWISFWSAGMDGKATPELLERGLLLTNASGVHGANIAEHVMAWMLMFSRGMHLFTRAQAQKVWRGDVRLNELTGQTLGIVGLGRIGEALAFRAQAFGMKVIAVKRNPQARYDRALSLDAVTGLESLPTLLTESDHVCIALPYTPETHHLFNAERLAQMKQTAFLYNIARGKIVDEVALVAALQEGRLAGAGLDVFEQEPLSAESALWDMENVLITPHVAGTTPFYFERTADLFWKNVARYLAHQPLENLFERKRGY
jgi:phosphoglycerate dehydrogenase-like enzyme